MGNQNKKKDKTRQSSSGGSAPGTPVPGERGSTSSGAPLTPGELKVNSEFCKRRNIKYPKNFELRYILD